MKVSQALLVFSFAAIAALADESKSIETIQITGVSDGLNDRKESNTQKIVIDKKEIASYGVMSISEALGKLPGVEIKNDAPRARGMSKDSVQILVDGERQINSGSVVFGALGRLPPDELERIEIVRGASAEFGGSASVSVNLVLKKAAPKSYFETRTGMGLRNSEVSYMLGATQNGGDKSFAWSFPVSLMWPSSPIESTLTRQNSVGGAQSGETEHTSGKNSYGHHSVTPKFTWKFGRDNITLSPMVFYGPTDKDYDTDISEYSAGVQSYGGKRVTNEKGSNVVTRLRVDGEKFLSDAKLSGRIAFSNGKKSSEVSRESYDASNSLSSYFENNKISDNEVNSGVRYDKQMGAHLVTLGGEFIQLRRNTKQDYSGGYNYRNNTTATTQDGALWVQDDFGVGEGATLTSGLRLENVHLKTDENSKGYTALLPSIAIKWEPKEGILIRSSLGTGMRTPKVEEIANVLSRSVSVNTPAEADSLGNPNLKPEKSLNYEAVAEYYLPHNAGVVGVNFYARFTRDFVERHIELEGSRWVERPYNEGDAKHWGVELDAKTKTDAIGWKDATVKAHLTLPRSIVKDERLGINRAAHDTPTYQLSAGIDQNMPQIKTSLNVTARYFSKSKTDVPNEQYGYTKGYSAVDASLIHQLTKKLKLKIAAQNLFAAKNERQNTLYYGADSWQTYAVDKGVRNFMFSLEGRW